MMTRSPANILKRVSLCSSLAIATAMVVGPTPAAAQSFEANNVAPVTTNGAIVTTSPGATNIALNGGQTVIDWTPNDTAVGGGGIGFQYGGTATFSSANNFAVLNRINPADPTRIISMDGNIVSTVGGQTGGAVYFYSPAGIVLGPNALINVGSLVLTTSPIEVTAGQFIGGVDGTTVKFGNANPNSFVFTNPGSTVNTLNNGSYVAMVAPRVGHDGTINVNGAAALVAAEAATISFATDGLFNITVDVGTAESQNQGIEVNGTITGPASSGAGDYHRAYLVAVPKNTLLTMAIGSGADLGFDIAGAADVVGNAIVLSAGHNIESGNTSSAPAPAVGALANLTLTNNVFTSALYGRASGEALVGANSGGSSSFASDVSLRAGGRVRFFSENPGSTVTVGGNLTLSANAEGLNDGDSATAGIVQLMTSGGGSLSVAGSTQLTAIGTGGFSSNSLVASGDGTGGTILVQSTTGGVLSLGNASTDTFTADASGHGGSFYSDGGFIDGGDGFGGTVNVFTSAGSSMTVAGAAGLAANGRAGQPNDCFQCGGVGGIGDAGSVTVQAHTGPSNTMTFGNGLSINASGIGGSGQSGGLGDGGDVIVTASGQSTLTVAGNLWITATGDGGNASGASGVVGDGGDGFGGDSDVSADSGTLDISGSFSTLLNGDGGSSELGNGGYGQGGIGELFAWNNGNAAVGGYFSAIRADGTGGDGLLGGGEGQGGRAYMSSSSGGSLAVGSYASLFADGEGGRAANTDNGGLGNGGLGEGGHVEAYANDATLEFQGSLRMSADGEGGDAGDGMTAGDSLGGDVYLQAVNGGALTVAGGFYASAVGIGAYIGNATISGNGTGGFIGIYARDGDSTLTVGGDARLDADGIANAQGECFPCGGIGGIGQCGTIDISSQGVTGVDGNVLTFSDTLTATANGYGGGGIGGAAGDGFGGSVTLNAADGNETNVVGDLRLEAIGSGGFDDVGLAAGDGTGGLARVNTTGTGASQVTLSSNVLIEASGFGGDSALTSGGTGGNGQAGSARVVANGGGIGIAGNLTLRSISSGGSGDNGGDGIAVVGANPQFTATSDARLIAYGGTVSVTGLTTLDVRADGGSGANGGAGGDAVGGYAAIHARNSNVGPSTVTLGTVIVDADGTGGAGGAGLSAISGTAGGDGGTAAGGFVVVTAAAGNGHVNAGNLNLSASATGGAGGDGGTGFDGPGGDGGDGGAATQGGAIFVGSESGLAEATGSNTGTASFGNVTAFADGIGGNGGFANSGFPGGTGGNGGSGDGGLAVLQTRGAAVTVGMVDLTANGVGGDGGGSATGTGGVGGDGIAGEVGVIATHRGAGTAQRGTLNAGVIFASATGTGGVGSTDGLSIVEGGSVFQVENADATIDALNILVAGDTVLPGSDESRITVINGAVTFTGGFDDGEAFLPGNFTFVTPADLSLYLSNSSLTGETVTLAAGDFVPDSVNLPPSTPGTIFADDAIITTGNNFIGDVNIDTVNSLTITAGGLIQFDSAVSGGAIDMLAQSGSITVEGVDAGTSVLMNAGGSLSAGNIDAGTFIEIVAGGAITVGDLLAGGYIDILGNGTFLLGDAAANEYIDLETTFGALTGGDMTSGDSVEAYAPGAITLGAISAGIVNPSSSPTAEYSAIFMSSGGSVTTGNVDAASFILLDAANDLSVGHLTAAGDITADAGGSASFGNVTSTLGSVQLSAVGNMNFADILAGTFVTIDPTDIVGGDVTALGGDVDVTGNSINIGNVSASDNVLLTALAGDLDTGTINAGLDVTLSATGDVTTSHITAGGLIDATGASLTLGNLNANSIDLTTTVADLTVGNVTIPGDLDLTTAGDLVFGDLEAFDVDLAATGSITGGNIDSDTDITATAGTGITFLDLEAGGFDDSEGFWNGSIDLTAGGGITTGTLLAFGAIDMTANGGALQFGNANALFGFDGSATGSILGGNIVAADIDLTGNGVTTGNLSSDNDVIVISTASIQTGDVDAFSGVEMDAAGSILSGDVIASTIDLFAAGDITTGDLTTQSVAQFGDGIGLLLFPGASITLESGGDIATGDITSRDGVYANAGGGIATGAIDAVDFVQLLAGGDVATGDIFAGGFIDIFSSGGGIATGDLTGTQIDLEADGDISFANVDAEVLDFEATGAVDGGDISAFSAVLGEAGGAVTLGDIVVGPGLPPVDDFSVGIASAASITVGNVSGTDRVGFATLGDLTTGNLSASDLVMTLVGGDITTGSITTQAGGIVYMADAQMYLDAGGANDDFDPSLVLAAEPIATGGSISIGGPVSTGQFRAAAGADLNAGQITAQGIHGSAGGTATISGLWSAGTVDLASNDINILPTGGISATGTVSLFSSNATQALIGDGLTGSGYALSNAEFGRIEGGSVYVLARGDASAAQDMLIGDLTVTGPSAGSTIESSDGILVFATGDIDSLTPSGVIRVVGDVAATGFGSGNAIEFHADRFELDAATGGISITSSGSALSGELGLYASQIHVASGSILDQLAVNPQYSGYQDDLNAPAAVQRPEGVLNAATIWIESDALQNILIQNTGTEDTPAGFVAQEIFVNDDDEIAGPPGSIDLVVNGQLQTEGGILTGIAVRDALVEGEDLTPFTENSTINGCELIGDCGSNNGPIIDLPTEFSLIIDAGLPELPFDGDENSSAIQAPPALFDTRPLDPDATVDEPISGSGNPALTGSEEADGNAVCATAGTEANPQCTTPTTSGDQK